MNRIYMVWDLLDIIDYQQLYKKIHNLFNQDGQIWSHSNSLDLANSRLFNQLYID